jgi:hypothetical protein
VVLQVAGSLAMVALGRLGRASSVVRLRVTMSLGLATVRSLLLEERLRDLNLGRTVSTRTELRKTG